MNANPGEASSSGFARSPETSRRGAKRVLLSLALCFHLFCILLAPNKETYLGFRFGSIVEPYINFLELATPWNFFAPEPGPPPVFVEWELLDRKGDPLGKGKWPTFPDPYLIRERQNRRIAAARFMVVSNDRTEQVMLPYLCKEHPEASAIRLWRVSYTIPGMADVSAGKRRIGDDQDVDRRFVSHSFCEGSRK